MKTLVAKADLIIPLAALVGVPLCNTDAIATKTTNQEAVEMLCRLASKRPVDHHAGHQQRLRHR